MNLSLALLELLWQPQVIPLRGQVEASCGIIITMMRFSIVVVGFFDSSNRVEIDVLACQNVRLRLTPSTVVSWWCCLLACAALQLGSFKKLVGPALCAPYSVPPNDSFVGEWWWNGSRVMRLYSHPNSDDDIWGTKYPSIGTYSNGVPHIMSIGVYAFFKGSASQNM